MSDDEPAVVAWGADELDEPTERRRPRLLARLRTDRRVVPVIAGVGAAAVVGSVAGEWRTLTPADPASSPPSDFFPPDGPREIVEHVVNLPAAGAAYLVGLFLVASSLALTLYGAAPVRHSARLVGLACAAVLAVVLVGTTLHLDHIGGGGEVFMGTDNALVLTYGRGLFLAYAGVAALALALWLAAPTGAGPPPPADAAPAAPGDIEAGDHLGPDWPWQGPPGRTVAPQPDQRGSGPLDLTVEPAAPFLHTPDETDPR